MLSIFQHEFAMAESTAEKRLARLAKSGVHFCEDTSKHAKDLRSQRLMRQ
jgi:hypothetical protein